MATFRNDLFSSLILLPIANACGHLAPAIGSSWVAVGMPILDYPVIVLLFSVHALLDSFDKYKDVPKARRPRTPGWSLWVGTLTLAIASAAYECGYSTAIRIVWFLGLEIFWAIRLIPVYTRKDGLRRIKLRQLFGPLKSVFCGVMAGLMDSEPASYHACLLDPIHCTPKQRRMQALAYSILYNFIRESAYDARDIEEDAKEGVTTMSTFIGLPNTFAVLLVVAVTGELCMGENAWLGILSRAVVVVSLSSWVAITKAREDRWVWATFSLLSLVPAWHAQAGLADFPVSGLTRARSNIESREHAGDLHRFSA